MQLASSHIAVLPPIKLTASMVGRANDSNTITSWDWFFSQPFLTLFRKQRGSSLIAIIFNNANSITVTSKWVWWRLKSPASGLFNQPFIQAQIKENIRVTDLSSGNSPVTGELSSQMASNADNVSIWWRHHVIRKKTHANLEVKTRPLRSGCSRRVSCAWFPVLYHRRRRWIPPIHNGSHCLQKMHSLSNGLVRPPKRNSFHFHIRNYIFLWCWYSKINLLTPQRNSFNGYSINFNVKFRFRRVYFYSNMWHSMQIAPSQTFFRSYVQLRNEIRLISSIHYVTKLNGQTQRVTFV